MHAWIIKVGEPLPIDGASYRPHRVGMLADAMLERGHRVTWWTSTHNHQTKRQRFPADTSLSLRPGYELRLIHSMGYQRNVCLRRLFDHAQLGRKFERAIQTESRPDLIYCCYPTIELALAATRYGQAHGIPVLLDVRDLWPDNFLGLVPAALRPVTQAALAPLAGMARRAFSECTGVIGISESYLAFGLRYAGRPRTDRDALFPLGYNRANFDAAEREVARKSLVEKGVDPGRPICWFVGMFGKTYNLQTVIAAARRSDSAGDRVQFVLSGAGEADAELRRSARGLSNVVFTGRIGAAEVAAMSDMASIGLMAYSAGAPQSLPNKLFEYMCAGIPIVSSLAGETEAVLRDRQCGLAYKANDDAELYTRIRSLVEEPLLADLMGRNGLRAFEERYAAEIVYAGLCDHLEQITCLCGPAGQTAVVKSRETARLRAV